MTAPVVPASGGDVAIIGMSGRFPRSPDLREFWRNISGGVECVSFFSPAELDAAGTPARLRDHPRYVPAQGTLDGTDLFDAEFFGLNPKEAELIDPQQRLLLECAWHAFEDSGRLPEDAGGPVGLFAGGYRNGYFELLGQSPDPYLSFLRDVGNEPDYMASRIAYLLGMTGAAVTVQTACSSSLVAVHLAARAVLAGECTTALAGGVTVRAAEGPGYVATEGGIYSSDGHCRSFDAAAEGTVIGEGVGLVVLRRLDRALADGDRVRAVIKGSALGNDGSARVGYTAPGVAGQARIVAAALQAAGVHPDSVGYVEAHGSGTPMGDRIEVDALTRAYRERGWRAGQRPIGSVKTNIGHTHAAAGIAGLLKTVLALEHGLVPPSLHLDRPNPQIDFAASPFTVAREAVPWPRGKDPRRAGVSSFGLGGTGAHVVLEEAPAPAPRPAAESGGRRWQLLTVSARSEAAGAAQCRALAGRLGEPDAAELADTAYTLHTGRRAFAHRRFAVAGTRAAAVAALGDPDALPGVRARSGSAPPVAFLLPGLGDQHIGMARRIRETEPVFRAELDRCADILGARDGLDLLGALYPAQAGKAAEAAGDGGLDLRAMLGRGRRGDDLPDTRLAQPAVFAVEYALARLWEHWGVRAGALLGYSIGEFTAACLSGVLGLEDALHLVAERARMLAALPGGSMLAVPLGEERLRELLAGQAGGPAGGTDRVAVAAVNGPELCVAAGPADQVRRLAEHLEADGVPSRPVQTTHAFHTPMMRPAAAEFAALVASLDLGEPRIPLLSNVTGDWMAPEQAVDPGHWVRHLCEPVRFAQSAARLWDVPGRVLLEVGPGRALGSLALQARPPGAAEGVEVLASLPARHEREPEDRFLLSTAGRLWQAGVRLDWEAFHAGERRTRVPLPGYPFERRRHWPVPAAGGTAAGPAEAAAGPAAGPADGGVAGWFSVPGWRQLPPLTARVTPEAGEPWLVFLDPAGIGGRLSGELRRAGAAVRTVAPAGVEVPGGADHVLDPQDRDGYLRLLRARDGAGRAVRRIVHLWSVTGEPDAARDPDRAHRLGFGSLLLLAQALGEDGGGEPVQVTVVSAGLHAFGAGAGSGPEQAVLLGIRRVWPLEDPAVGCRAVDLAPPAGADPARLARQVLAECLAGKEDEVVLRGAARYVQDMLPVRLPDGDGGRPAPVLREEGVYLITGGLGDLGLAVARHLAATVRARLVLTTRAPLPASGAPPADSPVARAVQELEKAGAQVLVVRSDAADAADMAAAVEQGVARFGAVHGAVHAAGVAGGGALQFRDPEAAAAVLAPKLRGARNLVESLRPHGPDFVALFASTLGVTGAPGQADYCAANAYLDALAAHEQEREDGGVPVVSIDWDGWQELGMAAREGAARPTGHPLLGTLVEDDARCAVYETRIGAAADWLVDEHRMHGHPVVPGTGHLELARAAFVRHLPEPGGALELDDVSFFAPVVLGERETRTLRTVLEWDRGADGGADGAQAAARFSVLSRREGHGAPWLRHCTGRIRRTAEPGRADPVDPAELAGRLTEVPGAVHEGPMGFGPRSRCVKRIWSGPDETLAELELPEAFAADLDRLDLHPSLLDLANAYPGVFLAEEFRIPIAYGRMVLHAPLPRRFFSHHRTTGSDHAGKATRTAEISLYAPDGRLLVRTEGFVLKHPGDLAARLESVRDGTAADLTPYRGPGSGERRAGGPLGLAGHLERTIAPEQGLQALVRVLDAGLRPQVAVAPRGLRGPAAAGGPAQPPADRADAAPGRHPRPALTVAYRAPQDGMEERIAAFMGELLGVAEVGAHDPFLDLGGHSLLALQLLSRLRQEFGTSIPLGEFFDSLTPAGLAGRLAAESA